MINHPDVSGAEFSDRALLETLIAARRSFVTTSDSAGLLRDLVDALQFTLHQAAYPAQFVAIARPKSDYGFDVVANAALSGDKEGVLSALLTGLDQSEQDQLVQGTPAVLYVVQQRPLIMLNMQALSVGSLLLMPNTIDDQDLGIVVVGWESREIIAPEALYLVQLIVALAAPYFAKHMPAERYAEQIVNAYEERDLFEAILETAHDAMLAIDLKGRIIAINLQFETFFHLPRHHYFDSPLSKMITAIQDSGQLPSSLVNILALLATDMQQSIGGDLELTIPHRRTLNWYSTPIFAFGTVTVGRLFSFRDVSSERDAERIKREFVSLVSHELRTPLTVIQGSIEMIQETQLEGLNEEILDYLTMIDKNTERLNRLVSDILSIASIEAGNLKLNYQVLDLEHLIIGVVNTMKSVFEVRTQQVCYKMSPNLPPTRADGNRMTQVLVNLLSNASKYSPVGTTITIEAGVLTERNQLPAMPPLLNMPALYVGIHDKGEGISEQDMEKLFTKFYRTKAAATSQIQGSGLGLAIVKSYVELHGGRVWVSLTENQGTSFYFTLPVYEMH